jgi:tRNA-dihydrouridine synthase A
VMQAAVKIPVTVKCRIGIDDQDEDADLQRFVETVAAAGCKTFIVHARKAWLHGLSPKENREIPPLNHARVYRLKKSRPDLAIIINGGISSMKDGLAHLPHVDGVMLGRAAYHHPWALTEVDPMFVGVTAPVVTRREAVEMMLPYIAEQATDGQPAHAGPLSWPAGRAHLAASFVD